MAQFSPSGKVLPPELLDRFKWEVAAQEGMTNSILQHGWAEMSSRDCGRIGGRIGGQIVRAMIRHAEEALAHGGT